MTSWTQPKKLKRSARATGAPLPAGEQVRQTMTHWQAQLLALAITISTLVGFVLLFSLLTGTL
jgi:uncharacterized membrane protein YdcZ (DUF606 family)